jgi:hypothetical protein
VAGELPVTDVDAVDAYGALDAIERAVGRLEGALVAGEAATERRDAEVLDLEADRRVDRVDGPGAGGNLYCGCGTHCCCLLDY